MKIKVKKEESLLPCLTEGDMEDHAAAIKRLIASLTSGEKGARALPHIEAAFLGETALTVRLLAEKHAEIERFFYDIVMRYVAPKQEGEVMRVFLAPFRFDGDPQVLVVGEMVVRLCTIQERSEAKRRFELLKSEIVLGLSSPYYAGRMLELKALSLDEKRALIQDRLAAKRQRFLHWYGLDLFSWMQRFFLSMHSDYLRMHEVRQVAQTIALFYLIEKDLLKRVEHKPQRRHLRVKVFFRRCHFPFAVRRVIGVAIGVTFLRDQEVFGRRHLAKALHASAPQCKVLDSTFFFYKGEGYPFEILYIECEWDPETTALSLEGFVKRLRQELPIKIKERIEHLHHPLFMPRNEEEVMRHIVALEKEVRFVHGLPQVVISFEQQVDQQLLFTVIIVRTRHSRVLSVDALIERLAPLRPKVERVKEVGLLRKKYPKEAIVIKVALPIGRFLRENQSVDFYRARRAVAVHLEKALGALRDYNGGMMAKQREAFRLFVKHVGREGKGRRLLIEHFFHSLQPVERRVFVAPKELAMCFSLFLHALATPPATERKRVLTKEKGTVVACVTEWRDKGVREKIVALTEQMRAAIPEMMWMQVHWDDRCFLAYLFTATEADRRACFKEALHQIVDFH